MDELKELAEMFGLEEDEMEDLLEDYGYKASDFFPWVSVEKAEKTIKDEMLKEKVAMDVQYDLSLN